jgi:hypothetical protein
MGKQKKDIQHHLIPLLAEKFVKFEKDRKLTRTLINAHQTARDCWLSQGGSVVWVSVKIGNEDPSAEFLVTVQSGFM